MLASHIGIKHQFSPVNPSTKKNSFSSVVFTLVYLAPKIRILHKNLIGWCNKRSVQTFELLILI